MRKGLYILFLILPLMPLISLDIWWEDGLVQHFSMEELQALSSGQENSRQVSLGEITPLYESIHSLEVTGPSGRLTLSGPIDLYHCTLRITADGILFLKGDIQFERTESISIHGNPIEHRTLRISLSPEAEFILPVLREYCQLKGLNLETMENEDPAVDLAGRVIQGDQKPHGLFFTLEDQLILQYHSKLYQDHRGNQALFFLEDDVLLMGAPSDNLLGLDLFRFITLEGRQEAIASINQGVTSPNEGSPVWQWSDHRLTWQQEEAQYQWQILEALISSTAISQEEALQIMEEKGFE